MATITDDDFEGSYPPAGYTEVDASSHLAISTVQANSGTNSLRVNSAASGAVAYMYDTVAGKMFVERFYLRIAQAVSATSDIVTATNANGNGYLRLLTTNVIRLTIGASNYNGPTLNLNQWYLIDARWDCTGAALVVDWQVDGSAQTQRSNSQTSANITALSLGIDTTAICDVYFDDYKVTDTSGDYPLGAYVAPVTSFDPMGMSGFFGAVA